MKNTDKRPLVTIGLVPQDAAFQWNREMTTANGVSTFFMENPAMGLKASHVQVFKPDDTPSHCQMTLTHKGGVIAVCTTADFTKIGFLPEQVRQQGIFDEFPRGFKDLTRFGIETSEEALRREMAEKNEANVHVRRHLLLAKGVNVDNALIVHPVTGEADQRSAGGNDFFLVIFPQEDLITAGDGTWTFNPDVTVDKKMSGMVFKDLNNFNPVNDNYGYGIDGFTLIGLLLFKIWKAENR